MKFPVMLPFRGFSLLITAQFLLVGIFMAKQKLLKRVILTWSFSIHVHYYPSNKINKVSNKHPPSLDWIQRPVEKAKLPTPSSISETLNSKPTNENKLLLIMGLSSVSILTCLSMLEWIQIKKWGFLSFPRKCHKWTHHTLYPLMMYRSLETPSFYFTHSLVQKLKYKPGICVLSYNLSEALTKKRNKNLSEVDGGMW